MLHTSSSGKSQNINEVGGRICLKAGSVTSHHAGYLDAQLLCRAQDACHIIQCPHDRLMRDLLGVQNFAEVLQITARHALI